MSFLANFTGLYKYHAFVFELFVDFFSLHNTAVLHSSPEHVKSSTIAKSMFEMILGFVSFFKEGS